MGADRAAVQRTGSGWTELIRRPLRCLTSDAEARGTEAKLDLGSLDALPWSGLITSDAPSITDTPTHPTITNETSPHFAETLIKWGVHPAGQGRDAWHTGEQRTTIVLLVKGRFRLDLSTGTVVLKEEGDYAIWGPGIDHSWSAEEDSVVITVRWPSRPE